MPASARVWPFSTFVGCFATFAAYIVNAAGTAIQQADLSSATVTVTRQRSTTPTVDAQTVDIATSIVDTPVTNDPRWEAAALETNDGRNFIHTLSNAAFPAQDHYRVEYTFTLVGGNKFKLIFEGPARSSRG